MASSSIAGDSVYDFWEAVTCAKCHLRFVSDGGKPPLVPFWITECGHILCNNHLNVDQSCSYCGDGPINLAPLQREMEPPISDWFRSLPYAIDSLANSVKFQQATMGSLLRYYREKIHRQHSIIEQLKKERAELVVLRSINEQLRQENEYMRGQVEYSGNSDPGNLGRPTKRQRVDHGHSLSSPRRMSTPIRPDRLTFPPDHQEPDLSRSDDGNQHGIIPPSERPGSSRFRQEYAYNRPETSQSRQQGMVSGDQTQQIPLSGQQTLPSQQHRGRRSHHHGHDHVHAHHIHKHRKAMPPPPIPRSHPVEVSRSSAMLPPPVSIFSSALPVSTPLVSPNHISSRRSVPMTPTNVPQRFLPPSSVSRLNAAANRQGGGQAHRMPFIPNGA